MHTIIIIFCVPTGSIESLMYKNGSYWCCSECEYSSLKKSNVKEHIEAKHVNGAINCHMYLKQLPSSGALRKHIFKYHNMN